MVTCSLGFNIIVKGARVESEEGKGGEDFGSSLSEIGILSASIVQLSADPSMKN